jgi:hypothetical protein
MENQLIVPHDEILFVVFGRMRLIKCSQHHVHLETASVIEIDLRPHSRSRSGARGEPFCRACIITRLMSAPPPKATGFCTATDCREVP